MSTSVTATVARDFFSEMSYIAAGSITSRSGVITINNVDTPLVAVTISTYYDQTAAPPITQWIMGGVFEITTANSTITRIRFEGRDNNGRLVTALEVLTQPNNPITIANTGLYAVLAVATLQPQKTVTITT
jgi:hypothetical protein